MKILIITLVVGLFGALTSYSASMEATNNAIQQIDATQKQLTNSTLKVYSGSKIRGTLVKECLMYVDVLNENNTLPTKITSNKSIEEILSDAYYTVEMKDENGDGSFDTIIITEN